MRTGAIIYPILSGYSPLTDLVPATKIFALRAQLQTQSPYLVYREISSIPTNTKGDSLDTAQDPRIRQRSILDITKVQISVFADDYVTVEDIAVKVREALDREWGAVNSPYDDKIFVDSIVYDSCTDDFDDDYGQDGIYMKHLEFTLRVDRLFIGQLFSNQYSLDFDGVDDYLDLGDADIFTPNSSGGNRGFSVSFWLKLSSGATASQRLITKYYYFSLGSYRYEWRIKTDSNSKAAFQVYGDDDSAINMSITIDTALSADTWYHIAFTYDLGSTASTALTGYLNGAAKTDGSGATTSSAGTWSAIVNTACPVYFARELSTYGQCILDEVSFWDDTLSSSEITTIYNSGTPVDLTLTPVVSTYLIGWWRDGDGATYPTIPDDSINYSNSGTMTNMVSGDIITDVPG